MGQGSGGACTASEGSVSLDKREGMPADNQKGTVSGWELGGQDTLAR